MWPWLWLIVLGAILAGTIAFVVSRRMIPICKASTTLLINQAPVGSMAKYNALLENQLMARTYADLLLKRPVLEAAIAKCKHARRHGTRAKLQMTPSKASLHTITTKGKTLCKQAAGATTPEHLIDTLNPVVRGWANYHCHIICSQTFVTLYSFVWRRLY